MPVLPHDRIAELLTPFWPERDTLPVAQLSDFLELLLKWNARTNLTAIRDPEQIIVRHFGESLFLARQLSIDPARQTLLDLGSGAGFPGIPVKLARPDLHVTLAESQGKKAAFLREAQRSLALDCEVWAARVEEMPPTRNFDYVVMRAVDNPKLALSLAAERRRPGGSVYLLTTRAEAESAIRIPQSHDGLLIRL